MGDWWIPDIHMIKWAIPDPMQVVIGWHDRAYPVVAPHGPQ